MKRSTIVVLILVAGIAAMIWSGLMAYRMRKELNTQPGAQSASPQQRNLPGTPSADQRTKATPPSPMKIPLPHRSYPISETNPPPHLL